MNVNQSSEIAQDENPFKTPRHSIPKKIPFWQLPLHGWYKLTAPPEAPENARLEEREASRRGHLASVVLFFVILLVLPAIPSAIGNPILTTIVMLVIAIDITALVLNRSGRTTAAGILVVIGIEIGLSSAALTVRGGFGASNTPMLDLMVQAECVAVSLLMPSSVFFVALINCLFFIYVFNFTPITPELALLLKTDSSRIISYPVILQVIVAIVTYLWVSSANKAIQRADRAEEIAKLEQREIELQQREIEQKQQLDLGIQQILHTHMQAANGNFSARAPLGQENVLWRIAYSLNNLLARLQSYGQMASHYKQLQEENYRLHNMMQSTSSAQQELQRTQEAAAQLIDLLHRSKDGRISPFAVKSGTVIDSVANQLSASGDSKLTSEQEKIIGQRPRDHTPPYPIRNKVN